MRLYRPSWERRVIARARAGTRLTTLESALIVRLFIKNQMLFTIAPGISKHGLEQLTSVIHFDEQKNGIRNEFLYGSIYSVIEILYK